MSSKERKDFITKLVLLQTEARRLGLWETAHALYEANRKLGSDLERLIKKKKK